MRNKIDELRVVASDAHYDVISISETWFGIEDESKYFSIANYNLLRSDRSTRIGGGVAVWINKSIGSCKLLLSHSSSYEIIVVNLVDIEIILCTLYIPPSLDFSSCVSIYESISNHIDSILFIHPHHRLIMNGDFNLSFINRCLDQLKQNFNMIDKIIGHTTNHNSKLDVVLVQSDIVPFYQAASPLPPVGVSDHLCFSLKPSFQQPSAVLREPVFDLRQSNISAFIRTLQDSDIMENYPFSGELDDKVQYLYAHLQRAVQVIPMRMVVHCDTDPPWLNNNVRDIYNKKSEAFVRGEHQLVKHYTVKLQQIIIEAKRSCLHRAKNARDSWNLYKAFTLGTNKCSISNVISRHDSIQAALDGIADKFKQNMGPTTSSFLHQTLINMEQHEFELVSDITVFNYLESIKPHGVGPDGVPNLLYKSAAFLLAEPLADIINHSFREAVVPVTFKAATVIPIPKKPDPSIDDLRPISLLPIPAKCLEFCALKTLRSIIEPHIDANQFAYLKKRSTCTALISVIDEITKILDSGDSALVQAFDLSKAFDTVPHDKLLEKLRQVGVGGSVIKWIANYLAGRSFTVSFCGAKSYSVIMTSGVPQGSLIGPLLFIFFIADLSTSSFLIKFADDLTTVTRIARGCSEISGELEAIRAYCERNGLILNESKSQQMTVTLKRSSSVVLLDEIQQVNLLRILGVSIDSKLTWTPHFDYLISKASSRIIILRQLKKVCNESVLWSLFRCSIMSIFDYCAPLFTSISKENCLRIDKLFNRCSRVICGCFDIAEENRISYLMRQNELSMNLFRKINETGHPLHCLLPPRTRSGRYQINFWRLTTRKSQYIPTMIYKANLLNM